MAYRITKALAYGEIAPPGGLDPPTPMIKTVPTDIPQASLI